MSEVCLFVFFQTISTTLLPLLVFFGGLVLLLAIVARIERWMWAMSIVAVVLQYCISCWRLVASDKQSWRVVKAVWTRCILHCHRFCKSAFRSFRLGILSLSVYFVGLFENCVYTSLAETFVVVLWVMRVFPGFEVFFSLFLGLFCVFTSTDFSSQKGSKLRSFLDSNRFGRVVG
jgi:hypothetical protein